MERVLIQKINGKEYVSFNDAWRYLGVSPDMLDVQIARGRVNVERVESRPLLTWASVRALDAKRRAKR